MPVYGNPSGRDTFENILKRLDGAENMVRRLMGSPHRSGFDRGDTASVPDPIEGQTMIQYDTETPYYYSNGQWRTFGGGTSLPFAAAIRYTQTFADNTDTTVTLTTPGADSDWATSDSSIFDLSSGRLAIQVPGTYLFVAFAFLRTSSTPGADATSHVAMGSDMNVGKADSYAAWGKTIGGTTYTASPQLVRFTSWNLSGGATPTAEPLVVGQRSGVSVTGDAGVAVVQLSSTGYFN